MIRTLTLLMLLVATAAAEPKVPAPTGYQWQLVPTPEEPAPQPQPRWYRSQMVLADVAAVGVLVAGIYAAPDSVHGNWRVSYGAIAYATLAPLVHVLHGNAQGAGRSLLLRVGLPLVGGYLAWAGFHCRGSECYDGTNDAGYELLGALAGAGVAMIVDDGWLAHERVERPRWAPAIARTQHGTTTLGLSRAF